MDADHPPAMASHPPLSIDVNGPSSATLQTSIQNALASRGWSTADDPVMAEYVLVMLANSKTREQIDSELSDLIGGEYDAAFTDWLWGEARRIIEGGAAESSSSSAPAEPSAGSDSAMKEDAEDADLSARAGDRDEMARDARPRSPLARDLSARRSASPPARGARRGDHWEPRQRRSPRRYDETQNDQRRQPRELFGGASDRQRPQRGDRRQGGLAMDDPSLGNGGPAPTEPRHMRIRGVAPHENRSFAQSMQAATNQQQQQQHASQAPRELFQNGAGGGRGAGTSLLARAGVPDPRAAVFTPYGGGEAVGSTTGDSSNSLFARMDPMIPNNAPPADAAQEAATTTSSGSFPTQPSQTSLCRYSLSCTNPLCSYSHASPAAALARRGGPGSGADVSDPILTSDRPCRFGVDCTNKECGFSHVSPAVAFVRMKQGGAAAVATSTAAGTASVPSGTFANSNGPSSTPCRFAQACTNPSCPYAHFDAEGKPAPSPALAKIINPQQQQQQQQQGPSSSANASAAAANHNESDDVEIDLAGTSDSGGAATQEKGPDGKPLALDRALSSDTTGGRNGIDGGQGGAKPCKFGSGCIRSDCWFSHPEWRRAPAGTSTDSSSTAADGGQVVGGGADRGKTHISDRLSRFNTESGGGMGEGDGEVERIIPTAAVQ